MNTETRIKKIQEIIDRDKNNPFGRTEIPWEDGLKTMDVYLIPLEYLVYNKYNGRILSRTKSLEKQGRDIDVATKEGKELIEELLWDSREDRNKKTLVDIKDHGQQKIGIITRDGIIIDGNRRAMLLGRSKKYNYFKTVVLPVTLEENSIAIEELETRFQMGEDEKLGYNATEKYLKAKGIYLRLTSQKQIDPKNLDKASVDKISDWMGETPSEIMTYLKTMVVMDNYLEFFEYDGIYTQLDGREDQFLALTNWLDNFYDSESKKGFDGYTNLDVDDLRDISFDYLRIRNHYDGKEFRNLANGNRENHIFGDKEIWDSFKKRHSVILRHLPKEPEINYTSKDIKRHLDDRDNLFFESSKNDKEESAFLENLKDHKDLVENNKNAAEPEKLVKKAITAFDAIKKGHVSFTKPEVLDLVKDLGDKAFTSLYKNSLSRILAHIIELLESIDVNKLPKADDDVLEKIKKIQKLGYQIEKQL